ncbi:MAG: Holliday junction branch migration protein RuvA [Alphaproteobacteria bacterium]|nr:Holliday junction branch migration protein RuvA [Alphaproteobacteria bacterium]
MIGKLRGHIDDKEEDSLLLDVGGVGYLVFCSQRTLAALGKEGDAAELYIEMIVREDTQQLYGFPDKTEREWFRLLTTVQRVGNKVALQIMNAYTPQQMAQAILAKDTTAFSRIKGIGAGLAERIVTELKDKVAKMPVDGLRMTDDKKAMPSQKPSNVSRSPSTEDAISALVNLGYSRTEAFAAALKASEVAKGLDEMIRISLKELARG